MSPRALLPREPSSRSVVFRAEGTIDRDAQHVWDVLIDLPRYVAWNPWLVHAEGEIRPGGVVWADVRLGDKQIRAKHVVLVVDAPAHLCWRDSGPSTLLCYGQRSRRITRVPAPEGRGVRLRQELLLEGPLRGFVARKYGAALESGLRAETEALKAFVERS
jgi:hypothetical protein